MSGEECQRVWGVWISKAGSPKSVFLPDERLALSPERESMACCHRPKQVDGRSLDNGDENKSERGG